MLYLKKKKMYEIAKQVFKFDSKDIKLTNCYYKFYRGTEWLECIGSDFTYKLCIMSNGNYLSAEKFIVSDSERILLERKVLNGFGKHEIDIMGLVP